MIKILQRLTQEFNNLIYEVIAYIHSPKDHVECNVPFVCQFSTPENAEPSLRGTLAPLEDNSWEQSGAVSQQRYSDWAFTMCGMASTAMVLGYFLNQRILPAVLAEDSLKHNVYMDDGDEISAMKYRQYASWIKKYGLTAEIYTRLSVRGLEHSLTLGKLVIVSVSPNIRGFNTAPTTQKGGHLVVVTGYNLANQTITINNPSGFTSTNTQQNQQLPVAEFRKYYAGRGIVVFK